MNIIDSILKKVEDSSNRIKTKAQAELDKHNDAVEDIANSRSEFEKVLKAFASVGVNKAKPSSCTVWLVGRGLGKAEFVKAISQLKAYGVRFKIGSNWIKTKHLFMTYGYGFDMLEVVVNFTNSKEKDKVHYLGK